MGSSEKSKGLGELGNICKGLRKTQYALRILLHRLVDPKSSRGPRVDRSVDANGFGGNRHFFDVHTKMTRLPQLSAIPVIFTPSSPSPRIEISELCTQIGDTELLICVKSVNCLTTRCSWHQCHDD